MLPESSLVSEPVEKNAHVSSSETEVHKHHEEPPVVVKAYAIVKPRAMVVHVNHALPANGAVMSPNWLDDQRFLVRPHLFIKPFSIFAFRASFIPVLHQGAVLSGPVFHQNLKISTDRLVNQRVVPILITEFIG